MSRKCIVFETVPVNSENIDQVTKSDCGSHKSKILLKNGLEMQSPRPMWEIAISLSNIGKKIKL